MYDVLVVGGGPAGLSLARHLGEKGISFLVLEEHDKIGEPLKCSGLISWNLPKYTKIDMDYVEHIVHNAVLHSPSGHKTKITRKRPVYIINRSVFDRSLAKGIEENILTGCRVSDIIFGKDSVRLITNKGVFESKMMVGADGPSSIVAKKAGIKTSLTLGIFAIMNEKNNSDSVDLFYDKNLTDGFLWRIPRGEKTEYGMLGNGSKKEKLEKFFGLSIANLEGGQIPSRPAQRTYGNRFILLGDAAGHTKPWSGGGVIYSLLCSEIAASVVSEALKRNNFTESFLKKYEIMWKGKIYRQIKAGLLWNLFIEKSNNFILNAFFRMSGLIPWKKMDMDFIFKN